MDRGRNIVVVLPEVQSNFKKYSSAIITPFNTTYDYASLMHYGKFDFAKDRNVYTIRPKAPNQNVRIGQRSGLSTNDILKINAMYPAKRLGDNIPARSCAVSIMCLFYQYENCCERNNHLATASHDIMINRGTSYSTAKLITIAVSYWTVSRPVYLKFD